MLLLLVLLLIKVLILIQSKGVITVSLLELWSFDVSMVKTSSWVVIKALRFLKIVLALRVRPIKLAGSVASSILTITPVIVAVLRVNKVVGLSFLVIGGVSWRIWHEVGRPIHWIMQFKVGVFGLFPMFVVFVRIEVGQDLIWKLLKLRNIQVHFDRIRHWI